MDKEIKLQDKDLFEIKRRATDKFINKGSQNGDTFLVKCVIEATLEFLNNEGYSVVNGRIVKNENT